MAAAGCGFPLAPRWSSLGAQRGASMLIDIFAAAAAAAAPFDPEAATRAYLDTLQGAARAKSDSYFEGGYWLLLWNAVVGLASAWVILRFGWSAAWARWAGRVTKRRWLQAALYALPWTL